NSNSSRNIRREQIESLLSNHRIADIYNLTQQTFKRCMVANASNFTSRNIECTKLFQIQRHLSANRKCQSFVSEQHRLVKNFISNRWLLSASAKFEHLDTNAKLGYHLRAFLTFHAAVKISWAMPAFAIGENI